MRSTLRLAVLTALAIPAVATALATPAMAGAPEDGTIKAGNQCADYNSGEVEYNNGNPKMEPATLKVYNCTI